MYNKVNKFKKHGLGHAFLDIAMIDLASISELLSKPVQEKKKKTFLIMAFIWLTQIFSFLSRRRPK